MEVLGYAVDTEAMTVGLPAAKAAGIKEDLAGWPPGREWATVGEVLSLAGKLHHAANVIRPARHFVRRLFLQLNNLHLNGSERAGGGESWGRFRKKKEKHRKLKLTPGFMAEVGWWRWYMGRQETKKGEVITSTAFNVVKQLPTRRWFCDASLGVAGGLCAVKRVYYRWNLPEEVVRRKLKHNSQAEGDFISINLLEEVTAVLNAYVMLKLRGDKPEREGAGTGIRDTTDFYGGLARNYSFGRVAESTSKNYSRAWRMWGAWRTMIGKSQFLQNEAEEAEVVEELAAFMAYCAHDLGNKESTIGGKVVAVSFYHQQYAGMKLPLGNAFLKGVRKGIKRKQAGDGVQQKIRRPLSWGMITEMQGEAVEWGEGERVLWIGFALSYLLMMRASELFAGEGRKVNEAYILTRGDIAFFKGNQQLTGGRRGEADKVEAQFKASKGDQERKGAILVRVKGGERRGMKGR